MINAMQLYYLLQFEKDHSFSIAAKNLNITQPSYSIAIKKLENTYNIELIDRNSMTLTPEGQQIAALAKKAFAYLFQIENLLIKHNLAFPNQPVTLYCNPSFYNFVYKKLAVYCAKYAYPLNTFKILPLEPDIQFDHIIQSPHTYILTLYHESLPPYEHLEMLSIDRSISYLLVPREVAALLLKGRKFISTNDLLNLPLLLPQKGFIFSNYWLNALTKLGAPQINYIVYDRSSMDILARENLGYHLFLNYACIQQTEPLSDDFVSIPIKPYIYFDLMLIYHHAHDDQLTHFLKNLFTN